MAEGTRRLFFALWPDASVAGRLHAAARSACAACGGQPTRQDAMHVTLAFLGNVPEARLAEAEAAASAVSGRSFVLELDRLGYWKHNRILWAGCTLPPPALEGLAAELAGGLRARGFELDKRPFAAHATLLRKAHGGSVPQLADAIRWPVTEFALVESRLAPAGSRYEVLRRWPLDAAAG